MFDDFSLDRIDVGEAVLRVRHGGAGPAVVLLHGHPRTHTTWHAVAPLLATRFTVVCPDLRGYGESSYTGPPSDSAFSKRAMARDVVALMAALGHDRFAVVGHDRGSYVAARAALDHPAAVTRLVFIGGIPIGEALARCDAKFAASWWHWFFLGQTAKPAERVINADPDAWYGGDPSSMGDENYADYRRAIHNPAVVHAMCEDYRAGLGVDRAADDADKRSGRRVVCPVLVLWALRDDVVDVYGDLLAVWREWATDLRGATLDCGHHMSEEAPEELAAELTKFLTE